METGEEESVYPVCMTGSGCQNLPFPPVPHTDCVFRVQAHGHQALQREQRKRRHRLNRLCSVALITAKQATSTVAWQATMKGLIAATENSCPARGASSEHIWVLLLEEPPIAERVSRQQQQQWSRRGESSSYGNPSPLCSLLYMIEDVLFDLLLNQCSAMDRSLW